MPNFLYNFQNFLDHSVPKLLLFLAFKLVEVMGLKAYGVLVNPVDGGNCW